MIRFHKVTKEYPRTGVAVRDANRCMAVVRQHVAEADQTVVLEREVLDGLAQVAVDHHHIGAGDSQGPRQTDRGRRLPQGLRADRKRLGR